MENMLLAVAIKSITENASSIPKNILFVTFLISVVVYLVCGFAILCLVHNLGKKLMLLGVLTVGAAVVFAVTMTQWAGLTLVLMFAGFFLVLSGAVKSNQ